jgi:hypothetical protein
MAFASIREKKCVARECFARGRLSGGFIVSWRGGFVIIGAKSMEQLRDN